MIEALRNLADGEQRHGAHVLPGRSRRPPRRSLRWQVLKIVRLQATLVAAFADREEAIAYADEFIEGDFSIYQIIDGSEE